MTDIADKTAGTVDGLNWDIAFDNVSQKERTRHTHGIMQYKGKFIGQLVEYFLERHFKPGDIIFDPFSGSGTTVVQANEMGMHAIGVDVSEFNCMIGRVKMADYDFDALKAKIDELVMDVGYLAAINQAFENEVAEAFKEFNEAKFPKGWKADFGSDGAGIHGVADETEEYKEHWQGLEREFQGIYREICEEHGVEYPVYPKGFIEKWYPPQIVKELNYCKEYITDITDSIIREALMMIVSRVMHSTRSTTHADIVTLKNPQITPYYCHKHRKLCRPVTTISGWLKQYGNNTYERLVEFADLKCPDAKHTFVTGDSRSVVIPELIENRKLDGIFSSPPYVGVIDYHEQHAYSYELFDLKRDDNDEIGPMFKGQGKQARSDYSDGMVAVLTNAKRFLKKGADVFLVANDKHDLYFSEGGIADRAGYEKIGREERPVLMRSERNRHMYTETIFHLKSQ